MSFLDNLSMIKYEQQMRKPEEIFLNRNTKFNLDISGMNATVRVGVFGRTGTGKTYFFFIILNQFPGAVMFFDPQNRAEVNLKIQDEIHKWEFYTITTEFRPQTITHKGIKKKVRRLQINARELNERIVNVLAKSASDKRVKDAVRTFCKLPTEQKTYQNLKFIFKKKRLYELFNELKTILHPYDEGMTIDELTKGKKVIDISSLTGQDKIVGVLLESILGYRSKRKNIVHPPLMVAIDECQRYCEASQEIGKAMGALMSTGRVFNIFSGVCGVVPRKLNTSIKGQLNVFFFLELAQTDLVTIDNDWRVRLMSEDFEKFPTIWDEANQKSIIRGWCYYYNTDIGMNGPEALNFDLSFKKLEKKTTPKFIIKNKEFNNFLGYRINKLTNDMPLY